MVASIRGCHLQSKEQFSLAALAAILEEPFCLPTEVEGASEANPERKLGPKKRRGDDSESTLRRILNAAEVTKSFFNF